MLSGELQGKIDVKDVSRVKRMLSNKEALMDCIPGITKVSGDEFRIVKKVAFLTLILTGKMKDFEVGEDYVRNLVEVTGPGVKLNVFSNFVFQGVSVSYTIRYSLEASNSIIESVASKESREISRDIISCIEKKLKS